MFNVEFKHSETKAWTVKQAGFVVTSNGKVIADGFKNKY